MNVDAEKLAKSIDAIPGVCEDGKKAIRKLFEDGFGVVFKKEEPLNPGSVLRNGDNIFMLLTNGVVIRLDDLGVLGMGLWDNGGGYCTMLSNFNEKESWKNTVKICSSPEEYFNLKREWKL